MAQKSYAEKLKDPRWQKMRLKVLERDKWRCEECLSKTKTLHVHHKYYESGKEPWDYPEDALIALCVDCHEAETQAIRVMEQPLLKAIKRHFMSAQIDHLCMLLNGFPVMRDPYNFLFGLELLGFDGVAKTHTDSVEEFLREESQKEKAAQP